MTAGEIPFSVADRPRGSLMAALGALAVLTFRQHLRGRRLLVLSLLFLLPAGLVALVRFTSEPPLGELEFVFVYNLIPHALATLTALLYAAGIIRDEVEEQTLTYLLLRPLPRWSLYAVKLLVTMAVAAALVAVFTVLTEVVIYWGTPDIRAAGFASRALKTAALMALAQVAYCALFGLVSLLTRWAMFAGLAYIVAFEGVLANFESVIRRLTVMYYFRVLAVRWLGPPGAKEWSLDLELAPTATRCVWTLLLAAATLLALGGMLMAQQEFRMKTPEGN